MLGFIRGVLRGESRGRLEQLVVREVVEQVAADFQPVAQHKGVRLTTTCHGELPEVLSNRQRLEQILLNLVGNAVKFTERGTVAIDIHHVVSGHTEVGPGFTASDPLPDPLAVQNVRGLADPLDQGTDRVREIGIAGPGECAGPPRGSVLARRGPRRVPSTDGNRELRAFVREVEEEIAGRGAVKLLADAGQAGDEDEEVRP